MNLASARAEIKHPPLLHIGQLLAEIAVFFTVAGVVVVLVY